MNDDDSVFSMYLILVQEEKVDEPKAVKTAVTKTIAWREFVFVSSGKDALKLISSGVSAFQTIVEIQNAPMIDLTHFCAQVPSKLPS